MDEDYGKTYGIEKLAEILIERGIEFFVKDEVSLIFKDGVGNWHECWEAGADENHVNALIVVTPEQLLSVPDLNGIITDNEKLRELVRRCVEYASQDRCEGCMAKPRCNDGEVDECWQLTEIRVLARELGIGVH